MVKCSIHRADYSMKAIMQLLKNEIKLDQSRVHKLHLTITEIYGTATK